MQQQQFLFKKQGFHKQRPKSPNILFVTENFQQLPNLVTLPTISTPFHEIFSRPEQCDQMVRSLIQHSVICISKNLPNCLIMLTNCAKHKISTQNWPKTLKICQIWSPWSQSQSFWCSNRVKKFFSVVHCKTNVVVVVSSFSYCAFSLCHL